jgi:putrescine transport system substrate-binding protein
MIRTATLIAAASLAIVSGAAAQDKVVNVYNWSDYIEPAILDAFTAETGIRVVYDVFDSNEMLETKLLAGGSGYDVVVPSGPFLQRQIAAGVYQPLQKDKLPNLANMWPKIAELGAQYDEGNAYSINYMWGSTGIGYNVDKVRERLGIEQVDSWSVVFDPAQIAKLADCGVMMLDAPDEIFRAALNYLDIDPDSTEAADYEKAAELMLSIRPYIQKFHSSEYINALANGDICLAVGWSGDMLQARDRASEAGNGVVVSYAIPKEGAMLFLDQMAIPADAPNVENAHVFLDYIMRPEVIAQATNYVNYPNGNLASKPFVAEEVRNDTAIYPDDATMANLYVVSPFDARLQRSVTRLWTQIRTGE